MNFVDVDNIFVLRSQQQSEKVARVCECATKTFVNIARHFSSDYMTELSLTCTRWSNHERVGEFLSVHLTGIKCHTNLVDH